MLYTYNVKDNFTLAYLRTFTLKLKVIYEGRDLNWKQRNLKLSQKDS